MTLNLNEIYKIIIPDKEMYDIGYRALGIDIFLDAPENDKLKFDFEELNGVIRLKINDYVYQGVIDHFDKYDGFYIILRNNKGDIWYQTDNFML